MPRKPSRVGPGTLPTGGTLLLAALACGLLVLPVKLGNPAAPTQQPVCPVDAAGWLTGPWPSEAAVILGVLVGTAALGLGLARGSVRIPSAALGLFIAFVAWELVCGASAESRPAFLAAMRYHAALAGFWYGAEVAGTGAKERRWLVAAILCALVYVALRGAQQRWWEIEATRRYAFLYEADLFGPDGMPESLRSKLSSNRVWGTFVYPNVFAAFLITALPASVVVAWAFLRRHGPRVAFPAAVLVAAMGGLALLYTESKAGLACALLGWSGAGAAWAGSRALRRGWVLLVAVVVAVTLAVALFVPRDRLQSRAATLASRGEYWRGALRLVGTRPLVGVGPGAFGIAYLRVKEPGAEEAVYAHSSPFQAAAESGIPGGVLWTCALAVGWVRLLRRIRPGPDEGRAGGAPPYPARDERLLTAAMAAGLGAVFLHGWFDFAWEAPGVAFPAAALLAQGATVRHMAMRRRWMRIAGPVLLAAVVLRVGASGVVGIRAETARAAEYALRRHRPGMALAAGREATRLAPRMPLAWESRARAAEAAGRPEEAAEAYRRAADLEPTRARYQYHFGRLAAGIPDLEREGKEALRRAAALYPTNPDYRPEGGGEDNLGAGPRIW